MPLSIRGTSNPNSTETLGQEASNQPDAGAPRRGPHRQDPAPDVDACPVRSESYGTPAAGFFHPPPPRPNSKAGTTHSIHPDAITSPECCTPLAWGPSHLACPLFVQERGRNQPRWRLSQARPAKGGLAQGSRHRVFKHF